MILLGQNPYPHTKIQQAYNLFHEGTLALSQMEQNGVYIDVDYIKRAEIKLTKRIELAENKFRQSDFYRDWQKTVKNKTVNIHSSDQLRDYLYTELKIKIEKETDTGLGSTDVEALRQLNMPALEDLIHAKQLMRIRDTFLAGYKREQVKGRLHAFYDLGNVITYRSSSQAPNQQNIPIRDKEAKNIIRGAIFPRKGHQFLEADYKQLEVRIGACYHQDPTMIKYIKDPTTDMHRDMAQQIFKIKKFKDDDKTHQFVRSATKNGFVFPEFYGDYYKPCAKNLAVRWNGLHPYDNWKRGEGKPFEKGTISDHMIEQGFFNLDTFALHLKNVEKNFWKKRFSVYDEWREEMWQWYLKYGYVESFTGFTFKGVMRRNEVINSPIQSAAFHVDLKAIILATEIQNREHWDTKLVGETHDSILLDVNPKELDHVVKVLRCIMVNDIPNLWKWITVPIEVDFELSPVDAPLRDKEKFTI